MKRAIRICILCVAGAAVAASVCSADEKTIEDFTLNAKTGMYTAPWKATDYFKASGFAASGNWLTLTSTAERYVIYRVETPLPLAQDAVISASIWCGDGTKPIPLFVSPDGEKWKPAAAIGGNIGADGWPFYGKLNGTKGLKAFYFKLTENFGYMEPYTIYADLGQAKSIVDRQNLVPATPAKDEFGPGRVQVIEGMAKLHPVKEYFAIAKQALTVSEMASYSESSFKDTFIVTFDLSNDDMTADAGKVEVYLPKNAKPGSCRVMVFQPGMTAEAAYLPNRVLLNEQTDKTGEFNYAWDQRGGWVSPKINDTLTFTWNRIEGPVTRSYIYVTPSDAFSWTYLSADGTFKPLPSGTVPPDMSLRPLKIKATCVKEKAQAGMHAMVFSSNPYRPIDDIDGRGNKWMGWNVLGIFQKGKAPASGTRGDCPRLVIAYTLNANGNPLADEPGIAASPLGIRGFGQPQHQVRLRVMVAQ